MHGSTGSFCLNKKKSKYWQHWQQTTAGKNPSLLPSSHEKHQEEPDTAKKDHHHGAWRKFSCPRYVQGGYRFEPSLATLSCIVGTRAHTVAVIHFIGIVSFVQLERRSGGQGDNPGSATSIDTFLKTKSLLQTRIVTASALLVERPNSPAWQIDITQPFFNTF